MKLLVICQYFYPEEFRINDVCFSLAEMGHDVTVLTGLPNYPMGDIFDGYEWDKLPKMNDICYDNRLQAYMQTMSGVKVIRCNMQPRRTGKKGLVVNYLTYMRSASAVVKHMAADYKPGGMWDFDRILVFQYSPVTMAIPAIRFRKALKRKKTIPLFYYCFDLWPESIVSAGLPSHGLFYDMTTLLSRYIYKKADKLFISSRNFEKYFDEKHNISANIEYLPIYAEDLFDFTTQNNEAALDSTSEVTPVVCASDKGLRLLFAGNMGEMQSIDTILKAAEALQTQGHTDIAFDLVGDGSVYAASRALAHKLDLHNVVFYGRRPLEEMPKFYAKADAFLVTLKNDPVISYTLPGKVQSYMAAGKPILGAIAGETAQVIMQSGCGLVSAPEDATGLADIICQFASKNDEERRKYGALAKSYYDIHFSKEAFFKHLDKLLSK